MANNGVPGVNLAVVDAIQDQNTRLALRSIVEGWQVRNGASGSGANAFVTQDDLSKVLGVQQKVIGQTITGTAITPGELSRVVTDLHSRVFESQLFKSLAARVTLIDRPGGLFTRMGATELALKNETTQRIEGETAISTRIDGIGTRIGAAEAGLLTETTQRVNQDNAIQQTIATQWASVQNSLGLVQTQITTNANNVSALSSQMTQVQASVGANYAAIQQEMQARASLEGVMYAQYMLKIDVNGRVAGFGLANDGTVSDFIVRADRFSIVSPTGNYSAVIMTNNTISVFDENGGLRVRIGRLS